MAEFPSPGRSERSRWLPRVELSATEQIAIALRKEMTDSGFAPGDRISVSAMADRLGLDSGTIRTGMRQLADDGLLVAHDRGFRVPQLTGADVIDLYASRLHVGMVILRACAIQPKHRLLPARLALGALEAVARQGSRVDAGEADLRFQQELAEASGLTQSARSFHALTLRVRMFISVLQLDYSPLLTVWSAMIGVFCLLCSKAGQRMPCEYGAPNRTMQSGTCRQSRPTPSTQPFGTACPTELTPLPSEDSLKPTT